MSDEAQPQVKRYRVNCWDGHSMYGLGRWHWIVDGYSTEDALTQVRALEDNPKHVVAVKLAPGEALGKNTMGDRW